MIGKGKRAFEVGSGGGFKDCRVVAATAGTCSTFCPARVLVLPGRRRSRANFGLWTGSWLEFEVTQLFRCPSNLCR
ncbi:hypothetical protein B296_00042972 [Ensete ventricosum]|uniref:Uncharacterized protein n=1 Tax=Ensete ventricosum TaxID=4639 RepID=A0A426XYJ0_ENSVE|nr:hypothetical protein B296_00042972 [Ensete ventricosum]